MRRIGRSSLFYPWEVPTLLEYLHRRAIEKDELDELGQQAFASAVKTIALAIDEKPPDITTSSHLRITKSIQTAIVEFLRS